MKIVSWHPVLTDHQSYTLEALQQAGKCNLTVYVIKTEHPTRQAQGWVNLHASSLSPNLIPKTGWLKCIIRNLRTHKDAVHVFGSPFEQPRLIVALLLATVMGLKVFLISEPYSPISAGYLDDKRKHINWLKAMLRPTLYRFYGAMLRRRITGVFAISILAASQYRSIGIPKEKVFPFGYFVPHSEYPCPDVVSVSSSSRPGLRLIFIGTLISRKGLDVLIEAVKSLNKRGSSVSLDVYGHGDSSQFDFDQSIVRYCGIIPFGCSQAVIGNYDLLVLPSRYDGWGVVVNEALMAGIPVVCSNQVGAAAVVESWRCGVIFSSEDVSDLEDKLQELIVTPARLEKMSLAARSAGVSLDPEVAGRYMFDVISKGSITMPQTKPSCPWYEC